MFSIAGATVEGSITPVRTAPSWERRTGDTQEDPKF